MSLEKELREMIKNHDEKYEKEIWRLEEEKLRLQNKIDELESELAVKEDLETIREELPFSECECELPLEPIEVAQMLIGSTFTYETSVIQRELLNSGEYEVVERYDVDALEQIAEHLMVHVRHNRESEE